MQSNLSESENVYRKQYNDLQSMMRDYQELTVLDKPSATFYDFFQAGITKIEIIDAAPDGENLGYAVGAGENGDMFYQVIGGEPVETCTDPAIYPVPANSGMLYEIKAVLNMSFNSEQPQLWVYGHSIYQDEAPDCSSLIPLSRIVPFTADNRKRITAPIFVSEESVDIFGADVSPGIWAIAEIENDVCHLCSHGNATAQVAIDMIEWPDPSKYPAFNPEQYK